LPSAAQKILSPHRDDKAGEPDPVAAALKTARDLAESANRAKARYVMGIAHELRTPLNSILGYTRILLKNGELPGTTRDAVVSIQRSGEHLDSLVDSLLDLARIEAGRLRLDSAPVPLRELLDELVRMVAPQAQAKGLAFRFETTGRIPTWVQADAKRLRQVLLNLLGNALRYTRSGGVTLRVDARRAVIVFEVSDTGIGIAPEDIERIFLPFERGSAERSPNEPGAGLGLTITDLLTWLMGGELAVLSTPSVGSRFSIRLYLRELGAAGLAARPGPPHHRPGPGKPEPPVSLATDSPSPGTVLVVDDAPEMLRWLCDLLETEGYSVLVARSGEQALDSLESAVPDAVLLDAMMPGLSGFETCRRIKANPAWAQVPVIFMTGLSETDSVVRGFDSGGIDYLVKPARAEEILARLSTHTRNARQARMAREAVDVAGSRLDEAALTPRETEVLSWVAKGKTNRDIAEILGMSPRTVNKHLEHVFAKLGVETRAAAAALASRTLR
jgi:DNA-binding response OmpR family regulator